MPWNQWKVHDQETVASWLIKTPSDIIWSFNLKKERLVSFNGENWEDELKIENLNLHNPNDVLLSSRGKILFATDYGLFEFDPILRNFEKIRLGPLKVTQIDEIKDESLWVATNDGLFILTDQGIDQELSKHEITDIEYINSNKIWVSTTSGLYLYSHSQWDLKLEQNVNCISVLTDQTAILGTNRGVILLPEQKENLVGATKLTGEFIRGLFLASDGTLWCRSSAGILSYDGSEWTNHGFENDQVRDWPFYGNTYEAKDGTIWFTGRGGPMSYKDNTWKFHRVGIRAFAITETSNGDIWSLDNKGVYSFNGSKWEFISGYGEDDNADNRIWSAYPNQDGTVWVRGQHGLKLFTNGEWEPGIDTNNRRVLGGGFGFIKDSKGTLWSGGQENLYYYLQTEDRWVKELFDGGGFSMESGATPYLHLTKNGTLIAINGNGGLVIFDGQKWKKHVSYKHVSYSGGGRIYHNSRGRGFVEQPEGVFWLATNQGIRRIEGDSWYDLTVDDGLPSNDVHCVSLDNQGVLWIGTSQGLAEINIRPNPNKPVVHLTKLMEKIYLRSVSIIPVNLLSQ